MKLQQLNYYGYDRTAYIDCLEQIRSTNRKHMEILNLWYIVITVVLLYFSWQNNFGLSSADVPKFLVFLGIGALFEFGLFARYKFTEKYGLFFTYLNMVVVLSFGIVCSLAQPYMVAALYLVFLMMISLSYIDKFFRMCSVIIIMCIAFITFSYLFKTSSIMKQDLFNVIIVLLLSLVLHYTFQRNRMHQFIMYHASLQMQRDLEVRGSFDGLTELLNRGRFFAVASSALRYPHADMVALAVIDLDNFKQINDTLGHQMGDKVIQLAGKTIQNALNIDFGEKWAFPERAVKEGLNFAGRLGGDEFVVLLRNMKSSDEVMKAFEKMLSTLNDIKLVQLDGIRGSIGFTWIDPADNNLDKAYNRADAALYESKESGRNRVSFKDIEDSI